MTMSDNGFEIYVIRGDDGRADIFYGESFNNNKETLFSRYFTIDIKHLRKLKLEEIESR